MPSYGRPSVRMIFSSRIVGRMRGMAGDLGEPVVAERRRPERLLHGHPALRRQARAGEHTHGREVARRSARRRGSCRPRASASRARTCSRCASISRSASSGVPAAEQDPGGALEQHRQVAEHEPADEAELDDGPGRCRRRSGPSARTRPRSRSAACCSSGRCPWAPTSSRTSAGPARGRRRDAACGRPESCAARRRRPPAATVSSSRRSPATSRHLATSFSPPKVTIARASSARPAPPSASR